MNDLAVRARAFAMGAHSGQARRGGSQYFKHVERVANTVAARGGTDTMIAAAYLHDAIEDTGVTSIDIHNEFGWAIAHMVICLTDEPASVGKNRAERQAIKRERLAASSPAVMSIKLADIADNADGFQQLQKSDPDARRFAELWAQEQVELLPHLSNNFLDLINRGSGFTLLSETAIAVELLLKECKRAEVHGQT